MDQKVHKVLTITLLKNKNNRFAFCGLKLEYFKFLSLLIHNAKFQETLH